eukprot:Hpha_TRINITY_DN15110_c4_g4::TRINITY_DN15110_c4_g4_i1::g.127169::m.127169/K12580/CNOT3, NOT3; CCR4-NOT transcription complex subunit 3
MAKNQKLSAEIDRTIKKVQEGIILFEDIWEKLHAASQANLKERFQSDLKTEIKKLQRLRDQIKTWQGMPEIRDKRAIDEARRNIEVKMEQFKACERDAKIKTYSKVGLSLPHREDPEEAAREKTREWLNTQLCELNTQLEQAEVDIGGSRKKKGRSAAIAAASGVGERIIRHRFHIGKLEQLLRLLDNEQVTPEDIESIQEGVEEYVQNGQDPDFIEDEELYDELATVDIEEAFLEGKAHAEEPPTKKKEKEERRSTPQSQPKPDPKKAPPPVAAAAAATTEESRGKKNRRQGTAGTDGDEREKPGTPMTGPGTPSSAGPPSAMSLSSKQSPITPTPVATVRATGSGSQPKPSAPGNYAAVAKQAATGAPKPGAKPGQKGAPTSSSGSTPQATPTHGAAPSPAAPPAIGPGAGAGATAGADGGSTGRRERPSGTADSRSASASSRGTPVTDAARQPSPLQNRAPAGKPEGSPVAPVQSGSPASRPAPPQRRDEEAEARAAVVHRMLAQSAAALPQPEDTRKRQPYIPPNPFRTPAYYPQQPHSTFDNPEIFQKFAPDTLFFIFYYQQSTYQQYIAARELKRQSWRFHKRFQTWFQRADPPMVVNDDFEQGTYVYFDYEDGWAQRIRKDFTFRYCFLEDDLAPQH